MALKISAATCGTIAFPRALSRGLCSAFGVAHDPLDKGGLQPQSSFPPNLVSHFSTWGFGANTCRLFSILPRLRTLWCFENCHNCGTLAWFCPCGFGFIPSFQSLAWLVGNNPDSIPSMRRVDGDSWNNERLNGVPFSFQVRAHLLEYHALLDTK